MRKHAGDTRVRKHSRMERFLLPDHATEQAIVQIGHRRFLQLANCFSKLFSKLASCLASLASGSGAGVGQLQDRTEVSHPRGDVRFAGPVHFTSSFLLSARFRGGPTRDRVVFINPGRERRKKWPLPESRGADDLALCLQPFADAKCEGREAPSEGPSVDENLPISGRSLPRKLTEGCRLRGQTHASEPSDTYAWAVMSVGPDALLYGESVNAMLGLAPINPTRMFVATPRRARRKLPDSIRVEWLRGIKPAETYNGIPCQSTHDAILACKYKLLSDRLEAAARTAHEQGLISKQQYHALRKELRIDNTH